jgi:hypothetical protein
VDRNTAGKRPLLNDGFVAAALGFIGLLLRLPLMTHGLWRDEGSTVVVIAQPSIPDVMQAIHRTEFTPPLYYLLERLWVSVAGTSEVAMRLPSLACSLAAIMLLYEAGRRMGSRFTGVIAALLAATSPLAISVGVEVRAYGFVLFLATVVLYACVRTWLSTGLSERYGWAAMFSAAALTLIATHPTGIVVVATLGVTVAVASAVRRCSNTDALLGGALLAIAIALPILAQLYYLAPRFTARGGPEPAGLGATIADNLTWFLPFRSMQAQAVLLLEFGALLWLVTVLFRRKFDARDRWIVVVGSIVVAGVSISILRQLPQERHLLAYAPAAWLLFALLNSWFVSWLREPSQNLAWWGRVVMGAAAAYVLAGGVIGYPRAWRAAAAETSGARELVGKLARNHHHPILLVAIPENIGPSLWFYTRYDPDIMLRGVPHWVDPQYASYDPAPWMRSGFASYQADRVEKFAALHQAAIVLAVYTTVTRSYNGIPFSEGLEVATILERRHRIALVEHFGGTRESIDLVVFAGAGVPLGQRRSPRKLRLADPKFASVAH